MNDTNTEEELMGKIPAWIGTASTWIFIVLFSLCIFWFFIYEFDTRQKGTLTSIDSTHVLFEYRKNGDFTFDKEENIILKIDDHMLTCHIDSMLIKGNMHYIIFQIKPRSNFIRHGYECTIHQKNATFYEKLSALSKKH